MTFASFFKSAISNRNFLCRCYNPVFTILIQVPIVQFSMVNRNGNNLSGIAPSSLDFEVLLPGLDSSSFY